jgi:hypothetical protein
MSIQLVYLLNVKKSINKFKKDYSNTSIKRDRAS